MNGRLRRGNVADLYAETDTTPAHDNSQSCSVEHADCMKTVRELTETDVVLCRTAATLCRLMLKL